MEWSVTARREELFAVKIEETPGYDGQALVGAGAVWIQAADIPGGLVISSPAADI